jgi:uncharacterized protein
MNVAQHIALGGLWVYQRIVSPVLHAFAGPLCGCRFEPTCSHYAVDAVKSHGVLKGFWLGLARICRCHPWGGCGHDPVPEHFQFRLLPRRAMREGTAR